MGTGGQKERKISHWVRLASSTQDGEREKGDIVRYRKQKKEKVVQTGEVF